MRQFCLDFSELKCSILLACERVSADQLRKDKLSYETDC